MLDQGSLDILFKEARTHSAWQEKDVDDSLLHAIYDLARMGPTSANCLPMRVKFVKSKEAKEKLARCLDEGNIKQTMTAPVTAIIAYDMKFYEHLPKLFPHTDAKAWFTGNEQKIFDTAFRNGSLQGAYLIISARAAGLDAGPMSGFDNAKCDELFFKGTDYKSNFLCNLGYGDKTKLYPRGPRLSFDEACEVV